MALKAILVGGLLLAGTCVCPALSAPPPVGSDDYAIMHPYANWVQSQHDTLGRWCCDIGDGRPVDVQLRPYCWPMPEGKQDCDTFYFAHVTPQHFPGETDRWVVVPKEKIVPGSNPTGTPILWLYRGQVQCFAPPDGV